MKEYFSRFSPTMGDVEKERVLEGIIAWFIRQYPETNEAELRAIFLERLAIERRSAAGSSGSSGGASAGGSQAEQRPEEGS